jgi:hypothetical protein
MRKLAATAIFALSLVLLGTAPTLATSGNTQDSHGTLNVWCTPDKGAGIDISGALTVPTGSSGPVLLMLYGSTGHGDWAFVWKSTVVHVVQGQTSYEFGFGTTLAGSLTDFKVVGDGGDSRVINSDECGFRVPEAPSSALLMLGALPVIGLVGLRVAGIRLPLPHWRRIR